MPVKLCAVKLNPSVKASINIPLDVLRSAQAEATRDESELIHIHQGLRMRDDIFLGREAMLMGGLLFYLKGSVILL